MRLLVNFAAFQLGWFACVLGAANGLPWIGPLVVVAVLVVHLAMAARWRGELTLALCALAIGAVVDSLLLASGWLSYPNGYWLTGLAPYWLLAMWALFATTLNLSMKWMRRRFVLAALLGAVGGPLSYFAGSKMGAMSLAHPVAALTALGIVWAIVMPVLTLLAARLDGVSVSEPPAFVHTDWRASRHA